MADDTERLNWVMDILSLTDNNGDAKCVKLTAAIMLGKQGRDAIDTAMQAMPAEMASSGPEAGGGM